MARRSNSFAGSRALFVLATVLVLAPIASGSLTRAIAGADETDSFYREFSVFTEVLKQIRDRYVEETDLDRLFSGAFDGTADGLDPLATYVPEANVGRYREALALGARRSGLLVVRERGFLYVVGVTPGGPGADAGFESGDIISKLGGRSTRLTPLWEARVLLAGEPGTVVPVQVLRQGQTVDLELSLGDLTGEELDLRIHDGVPILRVSQFEPGMVESLETLLSLGDLAGTGRLILDLRSIAGGDLSVAFAAADLLVDGEFGELRERGETIERLASRRPAVWRGRLVVLTNRGSQGASEVFAVLLRRLAAAQLVGGSTFGHAGNTAQRTLSNGAELYFTGSFFVSPDGEVLNEAVEPDLRVTGATRSLSEADLSLDDLVLERAIGVLRELEAEEKKAA